MSEPVIPEGNDVLATLRLLVTDEFRPSASAGAGARAASAPLLLTPRQRVGAGRQASDARGTLVLRASGLGDDLPGERTGRVVPMTGEPRPAARERAMEALPEPRARLQGRPGLRARGLQDPPAPWQGAGVPAVDGGSSLIATAADGEDYLDEAMLRDMVRAIIREELGGATGERITRTVRKLVRAEITRTLAHALPPD